MKYLIEHIKDGRTREVTLEVWESMTARGDARSWRVQKKIVDMPVEIVKAARKKKEEEPPTEEETSTE